ncbi:elongation factor 1-gamma (EF-1-gamma) [Trypanosoma cruzi]|nr:elongation factor 1-gamma (EF-1-gamma) [Trypanosoma cruzi]
MVCAVPHCESRCQFVRAERAKGLRCVTGRTLCLSLRPCVCCARGSLLRCDVDDVAAACVLVRALSGKVLIPISLALCVDEWKERGEVWGAERGWLPTPPRTLENFTRMVILDSHSQHQTVDREDVRVCSNPKEVDEMHFMTANLIRGWLQRMEHVRQYALGVALMIVEERRHDIVALWVLRGRACWRLWRTWRTRSCSTEGGGGVRCGAAGAHDGLPVLERRVLK